MDGFVGWLHPLRFLHECNPSYGVPTLSVTPSVSATNSACPANSRYRRASVSWFSISWRRFARARERHSGRTRAALGINARLERGVRMHGRMALRLSGDIRRHTGFYGNSSFTRMAAFTTASAPPWMMTDGCTFVGISNGTGGKRTVKKRSGNGRPFARFFVAARKGPCTRPESIKTGVQTSFGGPKTAPNVTWRPQIDQNRAETCSKSAQTISKAVRRPTPKKLCR